MAAVLRAVAACLFFVSAAGWLRPPTFQHGLRPSAPANSWCLPAMRCAAGTDKTAADERSAQIIAERRASDPDIRACKGQLRRRHVDYHDGETALRGLAIWPEEAEQGKLPGVMVVHTAVGLQEAFMEYSLEKVASIGCVAFGADMYGAGRALWERDEIKSAGESLRANRSRMVRRALSAYETMRSLPEVDARRAASIGFCFGGIAVLDLARSGTAAPSLCATFSVHGILDSPDLSEAYGGSSGAVTGRVVVFHGEDDPFISAEQLTDFERNMKMRGADWEMVRFSGTRHAFTRPEKTLDVDAAAGLQFNEAACLQAWKTIRDELVTLRRSESGAQ